MDGTAYLQFVGNSTSNVVATKLLDKDSLTIGRDVNSDLVLDSLIAPRMISRLHARLQKAQPPSQATMRSLSKVQPIGAKRQQSQVAQPHLPRWILTDERSMNGVFVNDIKITSTILTHGDIITIGGLGQKVPIGTTFPQPDAEFIFRFVQPKPGDPPEQDDATLPMEGGLTLEQEDSQKTQPRDHLGTSEDQLDGEEKEEKYEAAEDVACSPTLVVPPTATVEDEEILDPTQLLPSDAAAKPSIQHGRSNDMMDIDDSTTITTTTVIVTAPTSRPLAPTNGLAPAAFPRTFSSAPTQILLSEPNNGTQMMELSQSGGHLGLPTSAAAAATSRHPNVVSADPNAIRPVASIDASMSDETSSTLLPLPTLDDYNQATTTTATISASFMDGLDGMAMQTQATQIIRNESISAPTAAAAAPSASARKASPDEDLYDEEDESPTSASAHRNGKRPNPNQSSKPANSKKRGRHDDEDDEKKEDQGENNDEDDNPTPSKKAKRSLSAKTGTPVAAAAAASSPKPSAAPSMNACPICSKLILDSELEKHVDLCLRASSEKESEEVARSLEREESAAAAAAKAKAAKSPVAAHRPPAKKYAVKKSPAKSVPRRVRGMYEDDPDEEIDTDDEYERRRGGVLSDEEEEDDDYRDDDDVPPPSSSFFGGGFSFGFGGGGAAVAGGVGRIGAPKSPTAAKKKSKPKPPPTGPKSACPLCSKQFHQSELPEHADECEGPDVECDKCQKGFLPSIIAVHKRTCTGPPVMCPICLADFDSKVVESHMLKCVGKDGRECRVCHCLFPPSEYSAHEKNCLAREANMSLDEKIAIECQRGEQKNDLCNDTQLAAITYVAEQAKKLSEKAQPALLKRFLGLGYDEKALKQTLRYIRTQAPIIIHVNLTNCMKFFVKDTHYRNQFETKTSCGTLSTSARTQWEDGLFNRIYHYSEGGERVKYGVLNIVQDPNGVMSCRGYGDSLLLLKNETVRLRTSFASRDTGGGTAQLASCEWYAHVLMEYSDAELTDVISVATGEKRCVSSARIHSYKEVQFHGPIEFDRDVEALVVNSRHLGDKAMMAMVETFRKRNNCNVFHMEADGL